MFEYSLSSGSSSTGYVSVTEHFLCLLGGKATTSVAAELYGLLAADGTLAEHVFDFVAGRDELEHFAIVEVLDLDRRDFRIAVRGAVVVNVEGAVTTRLSGAMTSSWVTSEARGVSSLSLAVDASAADASSVDVDVDVDVDAPDNAFLPIHSGVVRTGSVRLAAGEDHARQPLVEVDLQTRPLSLPRLSKQMGREKKVRSVVEPSDVARRVQRVDLQATPTADAGALWFLTLPDESQITVIQPIVIGRRPWATDADERSVVRVVADSPRGEISGTHLEVNVIDGVLYATDLDSTNGTVVYSGSRAPRLLHDGRITTLLSGDILDLGEDFSIVVSSRS
ncbi:MAG: FHA domain-containing protein [Lacisediminihabitans sp.]